MKNHKKNRAFTLIEMLGVLAIVALLLSISTISFRHSQAKARDVVRKTDLQMIADALISYWNDHWHFPSSIYDNWQALTISQALNSITEWGTYVYLNWNVYYIPNPDSIPYLSDEYFSSTLENYGWVWESVGGLTKILNLDKLEEDKNKPEIKDIYESIVSTIDNFEKDTPVVTQTEDYTIVTQWMCASSLRKYLIKEWYISNIPSDPSWESVNLQTNICTEQWWNIQGWVNANDTGRSIQSSDCYANTNFWCTQICKEWYVYVSDWEHFALIAHMENENGWNYKTTSCWSCEIATQCKHTENKTERTKVDQLPCDITDEFKNTFDCIQENWVVEYSTWEYYFYIY